MTDKSRMIPIDYTDLIELLEVSMEMRSMLECVPDTVWILQKPEHVRATTEKALGWIGRGLKAIEEVKT